MTCKYFASRMLLAAFLVTALSAPLALAGAALGTIAGAVNATVSGEAIQPDTVVFSGDTLQIGDRGAVVVMTSGNRVVFGQRTAASFRKGSNEVAVLLQGGNLSMYHPTSAESLCVRLGPLSVSPMKGFNTLGDVAMLNGVAVVTAKEGKLRLERNGSVVEVRTGQTVTVSTKVAREPQGAPSAGAGAPPAHHGGSSSLVQWITLGVGAVGATVGLVALSHSNNANDNANKALAASSAAASTASSALTAAEGAMSDAATAAAAAQAASEAAVEAALLGEAAANAVGCDLNKFANSEGKPSPYTPFHGFTCH
jgi:hypothetical protein